MRPFGLVGLDIAAGELRAAVVPRRGAPSVFRHPLPEGAVVTGEIIDAAAVTSAIREMWTTNEIGSNRVVIGLNNHDLVTRVVDMPDISDNDLRGALRYELTDMIPFPVSESAVDFRPIGPATDDRGVAQRRVLAVAALRETVIASAAVVSAAGLRVVGVDAAPLALVRAASHDRTLHGAGAVVDIGADQVTVVMHHDGIVRFTRTVVTQQSANGLSGEIEAELVLLERFRRRAAGGEDLATSGTSWDPVAEAIRGTIEYAHADDERITSVVLTGDAARCSHLAPQLSELLALDVEILDPVSATVEVDDEVTVAPTNGGAALAFGLALDGDDAEDGPRRLDLLSQPGRAGDRRSLLLTAAVAAVVTAIVIGGLSLVAAPSTADVDEAIAASQDRIGSLTAQLDFNAEQSAAAADRIRRGQLVVAVEGEGVDWAELLGEITERTPTGSTVLAIKGRGPLPTIDGMQPGALEIVVQAPSQAAAAAWVEVLGDVDQLDQPWITSAASRDEGDATFTISARLQPEPSEAAR